MDERILRGKEGVIVRRIWGKGGVNIWEGGGGGGVGRIIGMILRGVEVWGVIGELWYEEWNKGYELGVCEWEGLGIGGWRKVGF